MRIQGKEVPRWVLVTGGLGLVGGFYLLTRQKATPLPETPPPPPPERPPTGIPEIDPILNEIDQAIAKLREIIEFLRQSVEGADELIQANEAVITDAQNVIDEVKPKIDNRTATQQDAEKLLMVLGMIVNQFILANSFLATLVSNVNLAVKGLEDVVKDLEKQVSDLRYQLEPIPVEVSVAVSGTHASAGARSAPVALSVDQAIGVTGRVEAAGSWPFGCTGADVVLRDKAGSVLKHWHTDACCHLISCDSGRAKNFSESIRLTRGLYTIQASVSGTGGGGAATAKVTYKTARFLLQ